MMQHNSDTPPRITVLVSVGQHPESLRTRGAEQDARAVEMGISLANEKLEVLHAGNPLDEGLRSYAGMGLSSLRVLSMAEHDDAIAVLGHYLEQDLPDVILTGCRAERGESSGMLPFMLAESLNLPIVAKIVHIISVGTDSAEVLQALPRGQRRKLRVPLPFIASIDMSAPAPRQSAYGPASRVTINTEKVRSMPDEARAGWTFSPARKRPKRMKKIKAKTAADRFKAATEKPRNSGGKILKNQPTSEMAQAVFELLLEEGVIRKG